MRLIIAFILFSITAQAQVQYIGGVTTTVINRGGFVSDSMAALPVRDTTVIYASQRNRGRIQVSIDSNLYYHNGRKWVKLSNQSTDTTSLSNRINERVKYTDTAAMLLPYLRKADTTAMLSPYLRSSTAAATYVPLTRTLNGLALSANQTFATGTSGTSFNISSSGTTHTFNLPPASQTNTGVVTTGSQEFTGDKTFRNAHVTIGDSRQLRFTNTLIYLTGSGSGDLTYYANASHDFQDLAGTALYLAGGGAIQARRYLTVNGTGAPEAGAVMDIKGTDGLFKQVRLSGSQFEGIGTKPTGGTGYVNSGNGSFITSTGWWGWDGTNYNKFQTNRGLANAISTKTTNYTAVVTDWTILVDASSGNVTITLPTSGISTGQIFNIKLISATNSAIIDPNGGATIDGNATLTISTQYESKMVQFDGTNYVVI